MATLTSMWWQLDEPADPGDVRAILQRARAATPMCGPTRIIAIDGMSGSGKTTLANDIAPHLGAEVVHLDAFVPGWDGLSASVEMLITDIFAPLARGEQAAYPLWDWEQNTWHSQRKVVEPQPFIVIEGCGCTTGLARSYAALTVYVDAPPSLRRQRALDRDGETYRPHWERWAAQEQAVFDADRTRDRADVVITTGGEQ